MATAGPPPSPFIHQSFVTIHSHHNTSTRRPVTSPPRPATPGSTSTSTSTVTSITTTTSSMHSSSPSSSSPGSAILEPGPNQSYNDFVRTWQDAHIQRWLTDNRCGHHAQAFRENDIRGDIILELDMDTLKEIGIVSVGDRTRIKSAVSQLRKLCAGGGPMGVNGMTTQSPRVVLNGTSADFRHPRTSGLKFKNDGNSSLQEPGSISDTSSGVPLRTNSRSRPPPLQIDNVREKDLPQIQGLDSARSAATPTPRAPQPPSNNVRVPPKGPVPPTPQPLNITRSTPRLTVPSSNSAGSRSRTPTSESGLPPPFTNDPLPPAPLSTSPASAWATAPGERGLPRNPAPGNLAGGSFARATSPLPIGQGQSRVRTIQGQSQSHQRQLSSTSSGNSSRGHGNNTASSSAHPYSSPSATLAPVTLNSNILSPVSESFGNRSSTPPHGYSVGRGPFGKGGQGNQKDDEVRRKLLKFHLGNSNSRVLDVRELEDGTDLLERALRKFAVEIQDQQPEMDGSLSVGGWGIFLGPDPDAPPLSENELIAIFHAPEHPGRENLHLRQISQSRRANKLERIFGKIPPSTAPAIAVGPTSPIEESMNALTANRSANKKLNRASMISVMSGLGTLQPGSPPTSPGGSKPASSTSASFGKLRNFFGQRPPSELITSYLPEYFPFADKKVLKKTARNSMMRQSMKPAGGLGSTGGIGWGAQSIKDTSRFSTSTMASAQSGRNSTMNGPAGLQASPPRASQEEKRQGMMTIPRVSIGMDDGESMQLTLVHEEETAHGHDSIGESSTVHESFLDDMSMSPQPVQSQLTVEDVVTPRAAKRASKITELKPAGFVSHGVENLVTVDNVTTGIEQRRNRDSVIPPAIAEAVQKRESLQPKEVPVDEADEEDDEDEEEEEEEEEDEEDEDEEEDEDDTPDKVTSNAGNRTIKWIRGALIGSGSFGNVYLAMDAQRGLLMAVKQVSLKSSSYSQERKRSMLAALEREIELLKTLQHENIVQYLDSAIDENHLNIFLEYVPGGSVTSLLRNYGAFEESLTKNWVRQILRGLEYLHGQTIIHRDIKGANILVDNKGGIKISDFGISKKVEEGFPRGNRMSLQGSVFWMAPEVVKQVAYTSKADIWSVGCLIIEMLTSQHPFPEFSQMQAIFKLGSGTCKPTIPTDITADATDFLQKTFELDHNARPSAIELINHAWLSESA